MSLVAQPASARRHAPPTPSPSPTASPTPSPTPESEAVRFAHLRTELATLSADAPGRLGVAIVDVSQYSRFTVRGDEAFPLAGLVNVPIAVLAYRRADQRRFDLDARVPIARTDLRRGTSPIAAQHPYGGVSYANAELLRAILMDRDDTASDVVLRELGGPKAVDAFLAKANVPGFDIRKTAADRSADALAHRTFASGADNGGTPNAVANLLLGVVSQEFLRLDATNELLELLSEVHTDDRRLRAGFPGDANFAHETGTSATFGGTTDVTSDAGVLTLPDGRRVIVVAMLGESNASLAIREAVLESVARAAYRAYAP